MARVRSEEDRRVPGLRASTADGAQVVLDVAACAFRRRGDRLDRSLALELAENLHVRPPDDVCEDVEPTAMRHSDHDLVRAGLDPELDRLVEHRNHHVEPLDRELLLPEERALEVVLEALDLASAARGVGGALRRSTAGGSGRTRSHGEARRAPGGPRCARSHTRSFRSRSRGASAGPRPASGPRPRRAAPRPGCGPGAPASAAARAAPPRAPGRRRDPSRVDRGSRPDARGCGSP